MKRLLIAVALLVASGAGVYAQEQHEGRYQLYALKSGMNDLAILLDSATGRTWQVFTDSTGKITNLSAVTVEGVVYTQKDEEQLYAKVKSANIDNLSTSNSVTKAELDKLYGYGLDNDKLVAIRDRVMAGAVKK